MAGYVESKSINNVLFDIKESDIYVDGNVVPERKAIVRSDNGTVLGLTSDAYHPVSNLKVYENFETILEGSNLKWEHGRSWSKNGGRKTMSEIIFPDSKIITNNNDENHLRAYLTNSFDGKSSVKLEIGFYRLVCSNGAIIGERDELMIFRHVSDITSNIIDKFRLYMANKLDYVDTFIRSLDQMDFKDGTEIEKVMMDGKIVAKKYGEEMLETWNALDKVRNAWIIYNIFTEMITHKIEATMFGKMKMMQNLTKHFDNMIELGG